MIIKVFLAEDHSFVVQGIKNFLQNQSDRMIEVVGIATEVCDIIEGISKSKPNLMFLDINLGLRSCVDEIPKIRKKFPDLRIIVFTAYDDPKLVKKVLSNGADGFILKSSNPKELINGIDVVMSGKVYTGTGVRIVGSTLKEEVVQEGKVESQKISDDFQQFYNLTPRETEILKLIASGMSNKEVASELYISDQTVSVHRKNIMRKLNVNHVAGLVKLAIDFHLLN